MRFLIVLYLISTPCCWASYGYANDNSVMRLKTERFDTRIADFVSQKDMPENGIKHDWYKRDPDGALIDSSNFQNNILKILLKKLVEQFQDDDRDRLETIQGMLDFLNNFIRERFIPPHYQETIRKIFNHIRGLQHKPPMQVTSMVFDELSKDAQNAFRDDGVRVQTNDLNRFKSTDTTMYADPMLVEILFMQLIWNAEKRTSTRQELLDQIEKDMAHLERLFGDNADYKIVGIFDSLRSTLIEQAEKESPLPDLVKFIISLITENKKDLEKEYQELLANKSQIEWQKITKTQAKSAISIWRKKEAPKKPTEAEIHEQKKKSEKSAFKNKLNELKKAEIKKVESEGISRAGSAFESILGKFNESLGGIGGGLFGG